MQKVLLIDDDPVTQLYCKRILENADYEVKSAFDAMDGLKKVRSENFDFIIVDLVLPGPINGINVIEGLRAMHADTKILAYSGFSDLSILEKVIHAGANNFITKPFTPNELIAALKSSNYDKKVIQQSSRLAPKSV